MLVLNSRRSSWRQLLPARHRQAIDGGPQAHKSHVIYLRLARQLFTTFVSQVSRASETTKHAFNQSADIPLKSSMHRHLGESRPIQAANQALCAALPKQKQLPAQSMTAWQLLGSIARFSSPWCGVICPQMDSIFPYRLYNPMTPPFPCPSTPPARFLPPHFPVDSSR